MKGKDSLESNKFSSKELNLNSNSSSSSSNNNNSNSCNNSNSNNNSNNYKLPLVEWQLIQNKSIFSKFINLVVVATLFLLDYTKI